MTSNQQATVPARPRRWTIPALMASVVVLGGCASFSTDGGFGSVRQAAETQTGASLVWARSDAERDESSRRVAELLQREVGVDDAVQIALLNNRGLQAAFFELGISEADLVQAGRLPNPGFTFGRLARGDEIEWERGLHLNLARLLAMPLKKRIEQARFEQVKLRVTLEMLSLASETRKAWYRSVAAEETVRYMHQVQRAAEASAELARRMEQTGNWNKLMRAREQGFYADAALNVARAEQARTAARERLTRLMGVWGEQGAFRLPERLPELPKSVDERPDIERVAMAQRIDLQAAKAETEALARNLGLTRTTRFVNVLELGLRRNSSNQMPTQTGYEIGFELPLFDWGGARVAKAEAIYMQALERAAEAAVNARSEVREAYLGYRTSYDVARHFRDEIVPTRNRVAEENLLRYNGMLIGVFELLADARSQIATVNGAIDVLRDFWIAQSDMQMAIVGKPALTPMSGATVSKDAGAAGH